MVLRSDRRMLPAAPDPAPGFTVTDVGRLLSRERNRQGLSLQDVGKRTGIPVDQLRAAETGVLDRPDGLATLKTVRRYADFLGLPGDRFALAILERWPTKGGPHPFGPPARPDGGHGAPAALHEPHLTGPTAAIPALGPLTVPDGPGPTTTGGAPWRQGTAKAPAVGGSGTHGGAFFDTGVTAAVRAPDGQVWRRPRGGVPAGLQIVVVLLALAVLAGVALLAIDRLRPSWLRTIGLVHAAPPAAAGSTNPGTAHASGHAAAQTAALEPTTGAAGTTFVVRAPVFTVTLTSPGGPCWMQVTTGTSTAPLYAGVIDPGASHTFSHVRSLVVEMGSTAGRLSISSAAGDVKAYAPRGVPYKITVRTGH